MQGDQQLNSDGFNMCGWTSCCSSACSRCSATEMLQASMWELWGFTLQHLHADVSRLQLTSKHKHRRGRLRLNICRKAEENVQLRQFHAFIIARCIILFFIKTNQHTELRRVHFKARFCYPFCHILKYKLCYIP